MKVTIKRQRVKDVFEVHYGQRDNHTHFISLECETDNSMIITNKIPIAPNELRSSFNRLMDGVV